VFVYTTEIESGNISYQLLQKGFSMSRTNKIVAVTAAAMGGLLAGSTALATNQSSSALSIGASSKVTNVAGVKAVQLDDAATQPAKNDCKGMNDCKGKGGCKSSDNGCKGLNSCKGKGGCGSAAMKDAPATQPSGGM
jgi:hypothetical protein